MYDKTFIYKGRDIENFAESEQDLEVEAANSRSLSEKVDDIKIQDILKTEARYEGAIGLPKGQKTEIQIVDSITDEIQSKSASKNRIVRSSIDNRFLEKVKDEFRIVKNSLSMKGEASKEANESHFKLKVANYAKNGVKIKRVALVENKPYDN